MRKLSSEEVQMTYRVLAECGDNRAKAAKQLGLQYRALCYRLRTYKADVDLDAETIDLPGGETPAPSAGTAPRAKPTEEAWWKCYRETKSEAARNELVERYLYLAERMANKVRSKLPRSVYRDDVDQAARIGLMQAVETFDPARGILFATFAPLRIRGAILDELRNQDQVPRLTRARARTREAAEDTLRQRLGREPTREELQVELGWSAEKLDESQPRTAFSRQSSRCDEPWPDPAQEAEETPLERDSRIHAALRLLDLEACVLMYLYHWKGVSMRAIGDVLRLSESRISQKHDQALQRLAELGREQLLELLG